ncbi:MAG: phosphatase PAP2 family protein [Leptolyngbya sp. PLA1]|nr:phosphatase PAP2 family protein [Leptolyngbya sp. PLA1]
MYLSPAQRRERRASALWRALALMAALALTVWIDRALWAWLKLDASATLASRDWWQALRVMGYLPLWFVVGALYIVRDRALRFAGGGLAAWHRGTVVVLGAAGSGLLAEICKAVIRRQRPGDDGLLRFDWAGRGVPGLGIGTVSSHAAVAFGGAFMLGALVPAWRWPLFLLALGCAWSRVAAGAHFVSDCFAAALVSYAVVRLLRRALAEFPGAQESRRA